MEKVQVGARGDLTGDQRAPTRLSTGEPTGVGPPEIGVSAGGGTDGAEGRGTNYASFGLGLCMHGAMAMHAVFVWT